MPTKTSCWSLLFPLFLSACGAAPVTQKYSARITLSGHVPVWTEELPDRGLLGESEPVNHVWAVMRRSPEREAAWQSLLAAQQNPGSPQYHRWLTPEQIGSQFGVSDAELAGVQAFLTAHGLTVEHVARSRGWIAFGGRAAAVSAALDVELHRFTGPEGERIAAVREPTIPAELPIAYFAGLSSVTPEAAGHGRGSHEGASSAPDYNSGKSHYITPADFATIYDVGPVYAGGINGNGVTIAIVGRSRVSATDISQYRSNTGLPSAQPTTIIPTAGGDPGATGDSDQLEATIDVTRAAGVAPGAAIDLVVSTTPSGSMLNGLAIAIEYVIDNNLAPILSISFGSCEKSAGKSGVQLYDGLFQQAAAEGMSVLVSAGDSGAAGCDTSGAAPPATQSLSPNYICASASATCVGGTEFADQTDAAAYWAASNSTVRESALAYIPEGAWNEPENSSGVTQVWAGGGGVSGYITKPSWQTGTGVPADGYRDTPDISFSASGHDGYYLCYATNPNGDCAKGYFEYVYGTSAAAPSMAGVIALANQRLKSTQGNINPLLYSRANSNNAAAIFHDVTVASSGVANCATATPSLCNNSTASTSALTGGLAGYAVTDGYDLATGWGSLDVAQFLAAYGCQGASDGTQCDDGDPCTTNDACHASVCGGTPLVCTASDDCHTSGVCAAGACSNPAVSDGTACTAGSCLSGVCVALEDAGLGHDMALSNKDMTEGSHQDMSGKGHSKSGGCCYGSRGNSSALWALLIMAGWMLTRRRARG